MRVALVSDFNDWYDHSFGGSQFSRDATFYRYRNGGMPKLAQFAYLEKLGFEVPRHGRELRKGDPMSRNVVVYHDEMAHQGEGKEVMPHDYALYSQPSWKLMAEYIEPEGSLPTSIRILGIGKKGWRMNYVSKNDSWRSNVGEVEIRDIVPLGIMDYEKTLYPIDLPMWSIDLVRDDRAIGTSRNTLAVDFNTAPGIPKELRDMGVGPLEIYRLVRDFFVSKTTGTVQRI